MLSRTWTASTPDTFSSKYELGPKIGEGGCSVVHSATVRETGERVAVKAFLRVRLSTRDMDNISHEVTILRSLDHPNILKMLEFCVNKDHFYIVTELIEGGELFDSLVENTKYCEAEAQHVLHSVASALEYLHGKNVVHRDLKPENILLTSKNIREATIKVSDFGFSKQYDDAEFLSTALGTAEYLAPEIIKREKYTTSVDLWALGVVAYVLLCGYSPFVDSNRRVLFEKIVTADYAFEEQHWDMVSEGAKDLIRGLLVVDPTKRLTIAQVMSHPWLNAKLKDVTPLIERLHSQTVSKTFHAGARTMLAINHLRTKADGEITPPLSSPISPSRE